MKQSVWKRNAVIAVVALFVCVGVYLNWSYNQEQNLEETAAVELADTWNQEALEDTAVQETDGNYDQIATVDGMGDEYIVLSDSENYDALLTEATTDTTMEDYFASIRLSRQESRDSAVELLQETVAYETGADNEAAGTASAALEQMVSTALEEAEIEGLVIAKGYQDCVAYMSDNGISVAVAAPEEGLAPEEVAQICDIVTTQSEYTPSELKIIEVK